MNEPTKPNDGGPFFGSHSLVYEPEKTSNGASMRLVIAMHLLAAHIAKNGFPEERIAVLENAGAYRREEVLNALALADELLRQTGS